MKTLKDYFPEMFTILAWVTLLGFILYCTVTDNKTDSVRDAWNILILIAGFVWGSKHQKSMADNKPVATTESGNIVVTPKDEIK